MLRGNTHSRRDEIGSPKRSPWKVAVYKDPHPGQETPDLKMVESWRSVGGSITFFPDLMLFLRHQQCLNGPGSLKYLSAAVHHIPLPIVSTVNGTLQKQAAPLGCQEECGLVKGSGKQGPSSVHLRQDQSQRAALAAGRSCFWGQHKELVKELA